MSVVRAACVVYSPWVHECVTQYPQNCTNPGVSALALFQLLYSVGLQVQFTIVNDYAEAYDLMRQNETDLLCNPNYPDMDLMTEFGYTLPVAQVL